MPIALSSIAESNLRILLTIARILALCLLVGIFPIPIRTQDADDKEKKNVLIIYDERANLPGMAVLDKSIRSGLLAANSVKVDIYSENLDLSRFSGADYDDVLEDYFRDKYGSKKLDAVIAVMGPSLDFALAHGDEFAPGTPIIFCGVDRREIESRHLGPNVTGLLIHRDFKGTLDLALKLQPETKRAIFISGSSGFDQRVAQLAKSELQPYADRIAIEYWTDFELNDLLNKVSGLPPDTIVLLSTVFSDNTGKPLVPHDVVPQITKQSNVPVYGFLDQFVGLGIVGGHVYGTEAQGNKVAGIALQILTGEEPAGMPIEEAPASSNVFDARALRRWGLSEERLPAGTVIQFREPTAWEEYRIYGAALLALLLLESFLVASLVLTRRWRRKAERERNEFQSLAAMEHERLNEVVANVPGIVWESRVVDETGQRRARFVSGYVQQMLGYTVEECLGDSGFIASRIIEGDRAAYLNVAESVFRTGEPKDTQFRCLKKDGSQIWAESHIVPIYDELGTAVGLRGVTMDITKRKKAEEELGSKEKQLTEAQRLAQVGSWEWDSKSDIVTWSEEIYKIFGIDPNRPSVSYTEQFRLYTPESWKRLDDAVSKAISTGTPYELELEIIRTDGRHAWGSARGEVVSNNGHLHLRGTLQDITQRKRSEEAIRESEVRFQNMADAAPVLIWVADQDMQCTYFNKNVLEFTGCPAEELSGDGWLKLVHEDDVENCVEIYTAALQRRESFVIEYRLLAATGEYRWLYDTGTPQFSSGGELFGYVGSAVDITDLRKADEAIRESEARFRHMADTAPVTLWIADSEMRITFFNEHFLKFTGETMHNVLGDGWLKLLHADDREHYVRSFAAAKENRNSFTIEFRVRRADGEYRWIYGTAAPRFATDGKFLGYIGSQVDISDRRAAEEGLKSALEQIYELKNELHEENVYLKEVIKLEHQFDEIIGSSDALKYVLFKIEQVAPTDSTVLITGETGTGKELVARAIHQTSLRKDRPLVKVNCAALAAGLIESELFGHERGAFTGAGSRKIGRFELADGATIFLDEVGELPLELQAKLLRLIQEGEFERLGSSTTLKTDVRIMAATNRTLEAEVRAGRFREDLLFRLNVFPVTVPPLRERKEDIPELVEHFVNKFSKKLGKTITSIPPTTLRELSHYQWPGNVRELANVIERAVIGTEGPTLKVLEPLGEQKKAEEVNELPESLAGVERKHIIKTLLSTNWRIEGSKGAARILGVNPSTLRTRMAKLGIVKNDSRLV
jgi:PAS domain S-box-containing protein